MAAVPSGSVTLTSSLNTTIPTGTNVVTPYSVPVSLSSTVSYVVSGSSPPTSVAISKIAQVTGSSGGTVTIDLSAVVCSDGTTGFSSVRELQIFNDGPNSPTPGVTEADIIKYDGTAAGNPFLGTVTSGPFFLEGTTPKIGIMPGTCFRVNKPYGAGGWTVTTNKNIVLDCTANSASVKNYRVIIAG